MSTSDLVALTITNLRGFAEPFKLSFERSRKLCIVYGENGTGKTTLCDALELLGSGTLGSLDDKGLGQSHKYWYPAGKGKTSGEVSLDTESATYKATISSSAVTWVPDKKPKVQVLRRPQLVRIVTATPSERYKAISDLVDVAGVEQSEQALASLVKEVAQEASEQSAHVAGAEELLRKLFATAAGTGTDPVAWARNEALRDPLAILAEAGSLEALQVACAELIRREAECSAARKSREGLQVDAGIAAAAVASLASSTGGDSPLLLDVLEVASRALSGHSAIGACPVCESAERVEGLAARVNNRLTAMNELRAARTRHLRAERALDDVSRRLAEAQEGYAKQRAALHKLLTTTEFDDELLKEPPPRDDEALADWLQRTAPSRKAWEVNRALLASRASQLADLREALATHDENQRLAARSLSLQGALERGHKLVKGTRHEFVNGLLQDIAAEAARLYEAVHPGEGLAKVSLNLAANKRASLELLTSYLSTTGVPPQAYFSDSHLDTLGLCVFLAMAKRRSPRTTILVLDDVLASVDEPHVDRLIEMIYREAEHFRHVVVTTHYRPWREKLRWGWLKQGQCQLVELGRWTSSVGPCLVRSTSEIERLRKLVSVPDEEFDAQAACGKAGVVLEAVLDFLTELYECPLRRKPRDAWTLGDLLPAIGKKLRLALRVETPDPAAPAGYRSESIGPILDELTRVAQTRNVMGAHFARLSFALLDADSRHFASTVLKLADLLVHPDHGWPRSDKSGSHWSAGTAGKDALRLHPLQEPK